MVGVPDRVGDAARIFKAIAEAGINIDMIVQKTSLARAWINRNAPWINRNRYCAHKCSISFRARRVIGGVIVSVRDPERASP